MQADCNLFPGINPTLNSHLQQPNAGWDTFHARHITLLTMAIEAVLPDGFYATEEKSMQIHVDPDESTLRTKPDVAIYKMGDNTATQDTAPVAEPTLVVPVAQTLIDVEDEIDAVVIYEASSGRIPGRPITRIELLSPGNKPNGSHYHTYLYKRQQTILSGVNVVELDYLHETRPLYDVLPAYTSNEPNSFPYWVVVSRPTDNIAQGESSIYGISVLDALPDFSVPLLDDLKINLNLQAVYNQVIASSRLFQLLVDYDTLPINFDRYTPADQTRIRDHLTHIRTQNQGES